MNQSAYVTCDKEKIRKTMSLIVVSYISLNILGIVIMVLIGFPILHIIKPEMVISTDIMLGIAFYQFGLKFRNCYTSYFSCTNRIPYVRAFIISSIMCVVLGVLNLKILNWGMWGLIIAQIISQIYNFVVWPYRAHKEMELSVDKALKYGGEEIAKIVKSFFNR